MNYVLCGMPGSGKSALGKRIAARGEVYFRSLETVEIAELCKRDGIVLSTGGGAILRKKNVELLKENGKILYLKASVETLTERLFDDVERPILKGDDPLEEKVARILHERAPIYEEVADYILEVDGKSQEENAKLALALFEGKKED